MKTLLFLIVAVCGLWAAGPNAPVQHTASVVETMDAGGYTYMKVNEGKEPYWVAVTATKVKVGENVSFTEQMWMPNFKSRALGRTFEKILFASMAPGTAAPAEQVQPQSAPKEVLKKAEGGYSVSEVFTKRQNLKGKTVKVRGKVTKISRQIMKRNWVHLEDGTGDTMTDDLVFTANSVANIKAGDIVVATGKVETDKDFGYGYFYPVIVEESSFVKER
ncbi:OB-fold nucleic acid binding domain-containing protein [Sulfurimonas diazotrophicus]|uniref:OB-fold nucleic acid binding domain-containing protein n=1 Tax=Sulfurimonas diazotrophicus TaxID=3131939 RepID=A0ABZ3H8B2_9BACT